MQNFELRHRIGKRPRRIKSGDTAFSLPLNFIIKQHETALTISFITRRMLFGLAYAGIQSDYFYDMPRDSGVYLCPVVPTKLIAPEFSKPGDVDLIIIPYEGDELILHRAVGVEIKAIRTSFVNQGKSPNGFGFTQANGLLEMGFPYVTVAHLIVSDESPEAYWREAGVARTIDTIGRVELLASKKVDLMPVDLMQRAIGRMESAKTANEIGLIAAYLDGEISNRSASTVWVPECRRALYNPTCRRALLENLAAFFEREPNYFFDNPRH